MPLSLDCARRPTDTADHPVAKMVLVGGDSNPTVNTGSLSSIRGFATPYYNPTNWMELLQHSTRLRTCVARTARLSVGLGVKAGKRITDADFRKIGRNKQIAIERDIERLQMFINMPNAKMDPLSEILYQVEYDRQAIGSGYLELVELERVGGGELVSVNHVPGIHIRVSNDKTRMLRLLSNGKSQYFRVFGDTDPQHAYINKRTGEFSATPIPLEDRGTALYQFKTYCPEDDYYGAPTVASAVLAVLGNYYVGLRNVNYFRNNPDSVLAFIAKGGQFSADTKEQIELSVNANGAGVANAGKVMIIEPDMTRLSPTGQMSVEISSLKARNGDDGSHITYRQENNAEISEAFGFDSASGGTARSIAASRQVVQEQVIAPITHDYTFRLNGLIASKFGGGQAGFSFTEATNMDVVQLGVLLSRVKDGLTLNDIRAVASDVLGLNLTDLEGSIGNMPTGVVSQLSSLVKAFAAANLPTENIDLPAVNGAIEDMGTV